MLNDNTTRPNRRLTVAVIGNARIESDSTQEKLAFEIGKRVIDGGYRLMTGGLGGVMEAACRGGRQSFNWADGSIIGVLPGSDPGDANPYVDIAIPSSLDHGRNILVAQADAVVAVGGGAGTLSEMALAWAHKRLIIGVRCGGWSERLAGQPIDNRRRYKSIPNDMVYPADTPDEAFRLLDKLISLYTGTHKGIPSSHSTLK